MPSQHITQHTELYTLTVEARTLLVLHAGASTRKTCKTYICDPEVNQSPLGHNPFFLLARQEHRGKTRHALQTRMTCTRALGPHVGKKARDAFSLGLGPCAAIRFLGIGPLKGRLVGHRPTCDGKRLRPMRPNKAHGKRRGLGVGTQAVSSFVQDGAGAARGSQYP